MARIKATFCGSLEIFMTMCSYATCLTITAIGYFIWLMRFDGPLRSVRHHSRSHSGRDSQRSATPNGNTVQKKKKKKKKKKVVVSSDVGDYVINEEDCSFEEHVIAVGARHSAVIHRVYQGQVPSGRPVVLQHGLIQRGGIFVSSGEKSMAFWFARKGLDVWIPNTRCSIPVPLFPKAVDEGRNYGCPEYCGGDDDSDDDSVATWDWSIRELAVEDYDAVVSYVTKATGAKPIWLGHSQGAAQPLVAAAIDPSKSSKLAMFIGIAPAFFPKVPRNCALIVAFLCLIPHWLRYFLLGSTAPFIPLLDFIQSVLPACIFGPVGSHFADFLFRWNSRLWSRSRVNSYFRFTPSPVPARLICDWLSNMTLGGIAVAPEISSGRATFEAPAMSCPCAVIYGLEDELVDGAKLAAELERRRPGSVVLSRGIESYSHLDVLWARDAIQSVFEPIWNQIQALP